MKTFLLRFRKHTKYHFIRYTLKAIHRFIKEKYYYRASALTYTTLLSLVPLTLSILSIISIFPVFNNIKDSTREYIFSNFLPSSAEAAQNYLSIFISQANKLSGVNILFLFVTTYMLMTTIEDAFNEIWRIKKSKSWYVSLLDFILLFIIPFLISASLFIGTLVFNLPTLVGLKNSFFTYLNSLLIPLFVNSILFTALFIIIPNTKVSLKAGIRGGLTAALLLDLSRYGFAHYISKFTNYSVIYGSFALIPIFLIWLYLFWCVILFSAEIAYLYSENKNSHQ